MALFDTPEQVRARIGKTGREQDLQLAGLNRAQQVNLAGAQAGRLFGQAIGQGLGVENPELKRAKALQEITSKIDPSSPYEGLLDGAKRLQAAGFQKEAFQFMEMSTKFAPKGTSPGDIGNVGMFQLPNDGPQVRAFMDKNQRRFIYRDEQGIEQPLPFDSRKVTPSSTGKERMNPKALLSLRTEMTETESGMRALTKYMEGVGDSDSGLNLLADKWVGKLKTIFGGDLSPQNLSVLQQQGQLQGLLGRFRKEVVGGGVMTEQDALRIISALGGETNATRHPEIVRRLLSEIATTKLEGYNRSLLPMYEDQRKRGGAYTKKLSPITLPKIFTTPITAGVAVKPIEEMTLEELSAEEAKLLGN